MFIKNISLVVSIENFSSGISVSEDGKSLYGAQQTYFHQMLYFHGRVKTHYYTISTEYNAVLTAIKDGLVDLTGNFYSIKSWGDPDILNNFNTGALAINSYEQCCLAHKTLFGRAQHVDLLQSITNTHKFSELTVVLILVMVLVIYLICNFLKSENCSKRVYFAFLKFFTRIVKPNNFLEKIILMTAIMSFTLFLLLLSAFFTTDSILFDKPKTFNQIEELKNWEFKKLLTLATGCHFEIKTLLYSYNLARLYKLINKESELVEMMASSKPGLMLVSIEKANYHTIYWFYCGYDYKDCQNHFIHLSEPYGYSFGIRMHRKNIDKRKLRFLWRYSYSHLENGFQQSVYLKLNLHNLKYFGSKITMMSERKQEQTWMPISFTFINNVFKLFVACSLFSLIVFTSIELNFFVYSRRLNNP